MNEQLKTIFITADGKSNMTRDDAINILHELENDTMVHIACLDNHTSKNVTIKV